MLRASPGVVVEHLPSDAGVAARVVRILGRARASVESRLGRGLPARPHVVLAPNDREFARRVEGIAGTPPAPYVLAMAFPARDLVVIRRSGLREGTDAGLERTLGHELAHLVLGEVERRRGRRLERWLNEGLAEWAAGRTPTGEEASALTGWARFGELKPFGELAARFPDHGQASGRAYTQSMAFVCWLGERAALADLVDALARSADTNAAFRVVLGRDALEAEMEWVEELKAEHSTFRTLLFSLDVWSVMALLALVAFARHVVVTRRLRRELAEQDRVEDALEEGVWTEDGWRPGPADDA